MPRAKKKPDNKVCGFCNDYDRQIYLYWQRFCDLGMRPEFEALRNELGITPDGANRALLIKSKKLDPSYNPYALKLFDFPYDFPDEIRDFKVEGLHHWPHDDERLVEELDKLKSMVLDYYRNKFVEPAPVVDTPPIPRKDGARDHHKFIEWEECIRVYEVAAPIKRGKYKTAAIEVLKDPTLSGEKTAERRYKDAQKYIEQSLRGTFPS